MSQLGSMMGHIAWKTDILSDYSGLLDSVSKVSDIVALLCVDGTFLSGKYHDTLLTALSADVNNKILPLAFAYVKSENNDSWLWFLILIKTRVVGHRQRVCVISDRHAGILHALDTLHDSEDPATAWPDVQRRWCMRHLGANLYTQFHDKRFIKKFKGLCVQNQQSKFNQI